MQTHCFIITLFLSTVCTCLYGQEINEEVEERLDAFTDLEEEDMGQVELSQALLYDLARSPVNLNSDNITLLQEIGLLSPFQVAAIGRHRVEFGEFLAVEELQSISELSLEEIRRLRPFVHIAEQHSPLLKDPSSLLGASAHQLLVRWSRVLEPSRAYREQIYSGSPDRIYLRYRLYGGQHFRFGLTAEKDPGEQFFRGQNKGGFDYYSYHLYFRDLLPGVRSLAVGDFSVSMGQGLIMHNGYGFGKSAFVTRVKKGGQNLRPYTSVLESGSRRGLALEYNLSPAWSILLFYSGLKRDANILRDTVLLENGEYHPIANTTSLLESGLHRTALELEDKHALGQRSLGGSIGLELPSFDLNLNVLYEKLEYPFSRKKELYNKYQPEGSKYFNVSLDYSFLWRNFHGFGEIATDKEWDIATVNGFLLTIGKQIDLAFHIRSVPPAYFSLNANYFAESSRGRNETGFYSALIVRPFHGLEFGCYTDFWFHPWLSPNADAPSRGREQFAGLSWEQRRKWRISAQYRSENKELNSMDQTGKFNRLINRTRQQVRLQFSRTVNRDLELRSRIEISRVAFGGPAETGLLVAQDMLYKPVGRPYAFTLRMALFDTGGYESRVYAYENDLAYAGSVGNFSDEGLRYYLNFRFKGIRNLSLEGRIGRTIYTVLKEIGSGYDLIESHHKTELKLQLMYTPG